MKLKFLAGVWGLYTRCIHRTINFKHTRTPGINAYSYRYRRINGFSEIVSARGWILSLINFGERKRLRWPHLNRSRRGSMRSFAFDEDTETQTMTHVGTSRDRVLRREDLTSAARPKGLSSYLSLAHTIGFTVAKIANGGIPLYRRMATLFSERKHVSRSSSPVAEHLSVLFFAQRWRYKLYTIEVSLSIYI